MSVSDERERIANVIGRNFRRIREAVGLTQDEAAQWVRHFGPLWSSSRVGDFERGRSDVTVGLLSTVSLALSAAIRDAQSRGVEVSVTALPADFLQSDAQVELTTMGPEPLGTALAAVFAGQEWPDSDQELLGAGGAEMRALFEKITDLSQITSEGRDYVQTVHPIEDIKRKAGLAERRVAQRLGITMDELAELSFERLGQSFTEARNEIAGSDASQQRRGRVARELEAQLREVLSRGDR